MAAARQSLHHRSAISVVPSSGTAGHQRRRWNADTKIRRTTSVVHRGDAARKHDLAIDGIVAALVELGCARVASLDAAASC